MAKLPFTCCRIAANAVRLLSEPMPKPQFPIAEEIYAADTINAEENVLARSPPASSDHVVGLVIYMDGDIARVCFKVLD